MAKSIIILAIVATAYSAVINNEGVPLHRAARSPCSTCNNNETPQPPTPPSIQIPAPPPPPLLRTQNWSGLARSSDGLQNAVFSGAAAAADQGPLAAGQAYSIASSSAGTGLDGSGNSGSADNGESGSDLARFGGYRAGYGGSSGIKGGNSAGGYIGGHKFTSGGFKESHYSYQSGGVKDFEANGGALGSSSSQAGSFERNNGGYGRGFGGHFGAYKNRGDGIEETQNQNGFSGSNHNEKIDGQGALYQQGGHAIDFNSASSSAQSSLYGGNAGGAGYGHSGHLTGNHGGKGHFGSDYSQGQEIKEDNSFGGASGQGHKGFETQGGASSSSSSSQGGSFGGSNGGYGAGFGGHSAFKNQVNGEDTQSSSFGGNSGGTGYGHFGHENEGFSGHHGGYGHFGSDYSAGQQIKEGNSFGGAAGHGRFESSEGYRKQGRGFGSSQLQAGSQEGFQSGQYQGNNGNQGQLQVPATSDGFGSGSSSQQGYSSSSGASSSDTQSALSGALNLASQGLQASGGQAGCSTCGKSSYALSNAKSHSGSAVAVSIGG